jgi:hypothetical protein
MNRPKDLKTDWGSRLGISPRIGAPDASHGDRATRREEIQ